MDEGKNKLEKKYESDFMTFAKRNFQFEKKSYTGDDGLLRVANVSTRQSKNLKKKMQAIFERKL